MHCETSSGILNPIKEVGEVVREFGKKYIIDAMSSLGAIPVSCMDISYDAIIASANKCIEGVPGFGFVMVKKQYLDKCQSNSHSLSLDLYEQWQGFINNGRWRFTPPTHTVVAFLSALEQHEEEGGVLARYHRYQENHRTLVDGMRELGFSTLLPDAWQSPIITTFLSPEDRNFNFVDFYCSMKNRGFIIYPGKLTVVDSFRLGHIGQLDKELMQKVVEAVRDSLIELAVKIPFGRLS